LAQSLEKEEWVSGLTKKEKRQYIDKSPTKTSSGCGKLALGSWKNLPNAIDIGKLSNDFLQKRQPRVWEFPK